jgi:hypothetical protein
MFDQAFRAIAREAKGFEAAHPKSSSVAPTTTRPPAPILSPPILAHPGCAF